MIPEPLAEDVLWVLLKIELTEYSTLIATIEGCTFFATPVAVSEYPCKEISWVFKLGVSDLVLSLLVLELLTVINFFTTFSLILGTLIQVPITITEPSAPHKNGKSTVLPKLFPLDFCFFSLFLNSL